ncbi:MAG: phenylalanine--tRNA ligase subunit beta [Bacteroidales bacterium]|nr:phenylalanine--tRNA ligase subunit beta [Bacteroidales bacterium]
MKISHNWLKTYIKIDEPPHKLAEILTSIGLEVEGFEVVEQTPGGLAGVFTGEVLTCAPHPNADKLHVTEVSIGEGDPLRIVCGAPNVAAGQKVLVATLGAELTFSTGEKLTMKRAKIRGEESCGMICAEDELGLGTSHEGIIVLPPDTLVGLPAKEYLQLEEDVVFEIGLTPNRIDAASHIGVARDLAAWCQAQGAKTPYSRPSVDAFTPGSIAGVAVEVEATDGAPRYVGLTLDSIKVAPSPEWLQRRLQTIGIRPINNVVDITNYVLHETGQPLHAFDRDHVDGDIVKVRYAYEGEKFTTLDGVVRVLSSQDLMICNASTPMCMAGIFGGVLSGVTEQTTSIFLESAYFNPTTIRKSSKRHGIKTDASFRFERGADPDMALYALKRAALLLEEIAGAKVVNAPIDLYPRPVTPPEVVLAWEPLFALIGARLDKSKVKAILEGLECEAIAECDASMTVRVPLYRVDVTRACDLAEEILRIWGYNQVAIPDRVSASVTPQLTPDPERVKAKMENLFVNNGFYEIMCNSLCSSGWYENLTTFPPERLVRLLNPLSSDLNAMRQTLLLGGLEVIAYNMNRQQYDLRLFESGNVYDYHPDKKEDGLKAYRESPRVAVWMTGLAEPQQWRQTARASHFFSLKGYVEKLFAQHGLSTLGMECGEPPEDFFSQGLQYTLNGKVLAYLGVIQKKILHHFGIKQEVYAAEICWDVLFKALKGQKVTYAELPRYPEVRRDLALVLDEEVHYNDLHRIAFRTERRLLKRVTLFDVYRGEKLPAGKKQYAMGFVLQDSEKTLTDQAVDVVMSKLLDAFEKGTGAALR